MPELLENGLPARAPRRKFDFDQWADGQAWRFNKGEDYHSSTESFRANIKKWAKAQGYEVELRSFPTVDADGNEIPVSKSDPVGLGVRFITNGSTRRSLRPQD